MNKEEIKRKFKLGEYRPKISTKDLFLVRFYEYEKGKIVPHENVIYSRRYYKEYPLNMYTLAHRSIYDYFYDVFSKKEYTSSTIGLETGDIYVREVSQVVSNKKRISYKDAEEILETRNTLLLKK